MTIRFPSAKMTDDGYVFPNTGRRACTLCLGPGTETPARGGRSRV
ncbi:MAG: hypothetical protein ACK55Z_17785 [bacterium]